MSVILLCMDGSGRAPPSFKGIDTFPLKKYGVIPTAPYTIASLHSVFTGEYGYKTGVDCYYGAPLLKDSAKPLQSFFKEKGWVTRADVINKMCIPKKDMDVMTYADKEITVEQLIERHKSIIINSRESNEDFFLFLHYPLTHNFMVKVAKPFIETNDYKGYSKNLEKNYNVYKKCRENEVKYLEEMTKFIGEIEFLTVFSDHGVNLGTTEGEIMYGSLCTEETINAFIFMKNIPKPFPDMNYCGINLMDIYPTILDCCGFEKKEYSHTDGVHLKDYVKDRFHYFEGAGCTGKWPSPDKPNVLGVIRGEYKLIITPDGEKFYNERLEDDEISKHLKALRAYVVNKGVV